MKKIETIKITQENVHKVRHFLKLNANRDINKTNVKDKEIEFLKHGCFLNEITINIDNNHILDGQHRIQAYLNLIEKNQIPSTTLLDVKYIKLYDISEIDYCKDINSSAKIWKAEDFVNRNKESGIYINLYPKLEKLFQSAPALEYEPKKNLICKLGSKRQKAYRRLLILLKYHKGDKFNIKSIRKEFDDGTLIITDNDIQRAQTLITELTTILNTIGCGNPSGLEDIARCWINRREDYSFQEWIYAFKKKYETIRTLPKNKKSEWDIIFNEADLYLRKKNEKKK